MVQDLIHGSAVSYQAEHRTNSGTYGTLYTTGEPAVSTMIWPGLSSSFSVDVDEQYEEIQFNPAEGETNILECIRNVKLGEELPFELTAYPQVTGGLHLLPFITGSASALGDEPDSTSWLKALAGKYSLFTGVMFEDYKCEIPGIGVAKESISGFAGHRAAVAEASPADNEAAEDTSRPLVWSDISAIYMDDKATPDTVITHCLSDMSFGFTSEISKTVDPTSTLTTKMCGVRVMSRKMFVSLKLTWVDQLFLNNVTTPNKLNLKMVIGAITMQFNGLYWPKYVSKADPKELVGDTITCVVDQPAFTYSST